MLVKHMLRTAAILSLFAIVTTSMVAYTYQQTRAPIAQSERETLLKKLQTVVNKHEYDNSLIDSHIQIDESHFTGVQKLLGSKYPVDVYIAKKSQHPVALIILPSAPDGYNGDIKLLVGIYLDGRISAVRILNHRETPGLGDAIEERRSNWIHAFAGKSLENPDTAAWKVKRDSGQFDQFTGATITPRAVVKAVHNTLQFFQQYKDDLIRLSESNIRNDE